LKGIQRRGGRWQAAITYNGKRTCLGSFTSTEAAHAAYCHAAKKIYGEFFYTGETK